MFIKNFYLHDSNRNITINKIIFDDLNILVGTSGAGKTTIMHALYSVKAIAKGVSSPFDTWSIEFIDNIDREIIWSGKFSDEIDTDEEDEDEVSELLSEEIKIDGKIILTKSNGVTVYNGTPLPSLNKYKSNIYLLREDNLLNPVFNALDSIVIIFNETREYSSSSSSPIIPQKLLKKAEEFFLDKNVKINDFSRFDSTIDCREKIFFAYKYDKISFENFEFIYTSIFPSVLSIEPETIKRTSEKTQIERIALFMTLKMTDGTIVHQPYISSGMFKSMMILADLIFSNNKNLVIIDEIENSLGVNCLADIIQEIKSSESQYILSTHHPRIINDVPVDSWKIVSRKSGVISTRTADRIKNSSSNHDNFLQLINSPDYLDGNI
ncbi:MAG: ABC-type lipoprotein export system ATPase subunit [Colwellia sp.]|jgi:ABC-type lipoprotein export system ATPase subunit